MRHSSLRDIAKLQNRSEAEGLHSQEDRACKFTGTRREFRVLVSCPPEEECRVVLRF